MNEEIKKIEPIEGKEKNSGFSNIQTVLNIVFFIGIAICVILILTKNKNNSKGQQNSSCISIAYIDSDTLLSQYTLFQDLKAELETETMSLQQDLQDREKSLQGQIQSYQSKVQSGNISYDDAKRTEENLMAQQQSLIQLSEEYSSQIAQKEFDISQRVYDSLNVAMAIVNEEYQYDYILGYTQGVGILYTNPEFNITTEVLTLLNERYSNSKKK